MVPGHLSLALICLAIVISGCVSGVPPDASSTTDSVKVPTTGADGCNTTGEMVRQKEYVTITISGPSSAELNESVPLQVQVTAKTNLTSVNVSTSPHVFFAGVNETHVIRNLSENETAVWTTEIRPKTEFVGYVEIVVRGQPAGKTFNFSQTAVHELAVGVNRSDGNSSKAKQISTKASRTTAC